MIVSEGLEILQDPIWKEMFSFFMVMTFMVIVFIFILGLVVESD